MKGLQLGIITLLVLLDPSMAKARDLVPVGLQKQLLVDDYVIAKKQNVTRELGHDFHEALRAGRRSIRSQRRRRQWLGPRRTARCVG